MENKEMDVLWQLGKRISFLRKKKGYSQLSLSLESGISKSYLSDLERGKRNPTITILNRIANTLKITLEELFQGVVSIESLLDKE